MAGGREGVQKVVDTLRFEMENRHEVDGCVRNIAELTPEFVTLRK
jgi:isopentenyl diphosphate isomerase/L-lactate dehydrogenase-like FMN-dependent dehydrogenase